MTTTAPNISQDITPTPSPIEPPSNTPKNAPPRPIARPVAAPEIAPANAPNSGPKRIPRRQFLSSMNFKYHFDTRKQDKNPEMSATTKVTNSPESSCSCHRG